MEENKNIVNKQMYIKTCMFPQDELQQVFLKK